MMEMTPSFGGTARAGVRGARRGQYRHDRWSMTRRVSPIGSAMARLNTRNFTEYEEWRKQQFGDAVTRPHRITYRKPTT